MLGGEWRVLGRVLWVVANVVAGDNDKVGWKNSKAEMRVSWGSLKFVWYDLV